MNDVSSNSRTARTSSGAGGWQSPTLLQAMILHLLLHAFGDTFPCLKDAFWPNGQAQNKWTGRAVALHWHRTSQQPTKAPVHYSTAG
mmetsp:Transcript_2112/g.3199  ORF Transcript_2112/g.3199 Transcript_2112/m.3199 type:complete len:87 (-) Transcript_2112:242-502(-)